MNKKLQFSLIIILFIFFYTIKNELSAIIIKNHVIKNEKNMIFVKTEEYLNKIASLENNTATTIIIGSGPAGQAAAMYCARLGGKPLIITGSDGGQLEYTGIVENIPYVINKPGKEVVSLGIQQAKSFGAITVNEVVTKIILDEYPFKVITDKNVYYAFSLILAMGSYIKKLECIGAEKYWGRGISSCAVCDAPFYKNKKVIVVGGGDSACEEAIQLSFYAEEIYVFVRKDTMRASKIMREKIENNNKIKIFYNTEIQEIIGDEEKITKVIALSEGQKKEFIISGIFIAIGQYPNTELVKGLVDLDPETKALVYRGRSQSTSLPGVYGAGEIGDIKYKQAGVASAEGIKAALDAFDFLSEQKINDEFIKKYAKIWIIEEKNNKIKNCPNGVCSINKNTQSVKSVINEKKSIKNISYPKEFKDILQKNKNNYFLIDFTAPWCSGCKVLKKTLDQYIEEKDSISVYAVNIDEMKTHHIDFIKPNISIQSIPLLLLMHEGRVIAQHVGSMNLQELNAWIKKNKKE